VEVAGRDVGRLPSRHCLELNTHLIEQIIGEWSASDPATRKAALEYLRRHAEAKGAPDPAVMPSAGQVGEKGASLRSAPFSISRRFYQAVEDGN
jgi:hypothetical protein